MKCHRLIAAIVVLIASQLLAEEIDYSRLQLAHSLKGHEATIRAIAISPDGQTLASGGRDKTIRLWDVGQGTTRAVMRGHEATIRVLRFSPDGTMLASGAYGGGKDIVRLWDVADAKQLASRATTKTGTRVMTFSHDGKTLAWDDLGKTIRLYDVTNGKESAVLKTAGVVRMIALSPDGQTVSASFFHGAGFQVWRTNGTELGVVKGKFTAVRFSDDGKSLMVGEFRKVTKWDVSVGNELTKIETVAPEKAIPDPFPKAHFLPDGKTLATVDKDLTVVNLGGDLGTFGAQQCRLILMDVSSGKERMLYETRGRKKWFHLATYTRDGKTLALQNSGYSFTLVDAASGKRTSRLISPDVESGSGYPRIVIARDGKKIAISRGMAIKLWVMP